MPVHRIALVIALLAVAPLAVALPAHAQLLSRRDLSYAIAKTIAEGAIDDCQARGYAESVVVVDRDGETMIALRGDNAAPHTMENARRKAYTARAVRGPTTDYAKRYAANDPLVHQQVTLPSMIAIGGGLPIIVNGDALGGVGGSGSPVFDEACVKAWLDKVADQLR